MKYPPLFGLLFGLILGLSCNKVQAQYQYSFQNPKLSVEERVDNIISLLTLDEKVACLSTNPSVPRLGIKGSGHVEGLHGVTQGGPANWGGRNREQQATTTFPQSIGLAETWDKKALHTVGAVEGYETRYLFQNPKHHRGGLVVRAPNADLGRDPRWGRTEECYGEDAFFNASMVVSFIKGLQGDDPNYWQAASLMKHFLANSNENGRDSTSSNFDERLLREYYSYPFWKGVTEGGSRAYMAAYNSYNGIPCTVHPMLKGITVNEWGQNGIICTDGGAYQMLVTAHHFYPDLNLAAAGCLKAGINQFLDRYREGVYGALANKYITETAIDSVLRGNFRVMIKLGLLDPTDLVPYNQIGLKDTLDPWLSDKHKQIARKVTQESIVLLKNEKQLLPLDKEKLKSIAVIGELANEVLLDWYSGTPPYRITPLEGIRNKVGKNAVVSFVAGNVADSTVIAARNADVAIVCVGNHPTGDGGWKEVAKDSYGKEAVDRKSIHLEDEELIKQVFQANPNTIVVLISSFPYAINWTQEYVPAIVHLAHNSQELGNALADVLFGDYNPAGRLVQTWPKLMKQLPDMMDYNINHGRTYMYFEGAPLYPFGYGLSYTNFSYSKMKISKQTNEKSDFVVSVNIKNTGKMAGDEVVQLYVKHLNSKVERPNQELKGFERISIQPNETKTVQLPIKLESLAYWDVQKHQWVVEKDRIKIMLGSSSKDIRLEKTIDL